MKITGFIGLFLIAVGSAMQWLFHSKAELIRMNEAYVQGAKAGEHGAPMNYFHQEWTLPSDIIAMGYLATAATFAGIFLTAVALHKAS